MTWLHVPFEGSPSVPASVDRTVVWFSAGAASAVAAKIVLTDTPDAVLAYIDVGAEHEDNQRFIADCERWLGVDVVRLRSDTYSSPWDVWARKRYLAGIAGAPCTLELKKRVRYRFQRPTDRQVFGYTAEARERTRADRLRESDPGINLVTPLIDRGVTKADCLAILEAAGIEQPVMYRLGYRNNNCIGCVKGGIGYWNKIRRDFPETFDRMARLERDIGHAVLKDKHGPLWLDKLDPGRGNYKGEPEAPCGLLCESVLNP